ncbi:Biotin--protein ligase [Schizosaccharomyces pombe]
MRFVDASTLEKEPWPASTALLVMPGGRDMGYCSSFNETIYRKITDFVKRGGAYLGLCAGGYFGSAVVDFRMPDSDLNVVGKRKLQFFPGTCAGPTFPGFTYDSEDGARRASIIVDGMQSSPVHTHIYFNGGGSFLETENYSNVKVVARYQETDFEKSAAIIYVKVGKGNVVLTGIHPEFSAEGSPILDKRDEKTRLELLSYILKLLGLKVPKDTSKCGQPTLTDQYLFPNNVETKRFIEKALTNKVKNQDEDTLYTFQFSDISSEIPEHQLANLDISADLSDSDNEIVKIWYGDEEKICKKAKPSFDLELYAKLINGCRFGLPIIVAPVIRSTQTLLDKNYRFLDSTNTGFTVLGNYQTAGRGRGQNMWVSPYGTLAFSFIINVDAKNFSTTPIALFQYLMALAVVRGIREYAPGYENIPAFIKWPNDVYVRVDKGGINFQGKQYMKLSGIIVTSNYRKNVLHLVVGCGINVSNLGPTVSLNTLVDEWNKNSDNPRLEKFSFEKLLASVLNQFDRYHRLLLEEGFSLILPEYYQYWLHSNQTVNLASGGKAIIQGITSDFGFLLAQLLNENNEPTTKVVHLQPDGNSFDLMRNLITRKT